MSNIVLIKPNGVYTYNKELHEVRGIEPPIYLTILANYYKNENASIIDAELLNLSVEETASRTIAKNPQKVVILASGSHPSAHIQQIDTMNEIKELVHKELPSIEIETHSKLPIDVCKWSPPAWDLLGKDILEYRSHNWHSYTNNGITKPYGVIFTSTGCPFSCNFCCVKPFYGTTFQQRTIEDVMYDFATWADLGVKNIKIMDELFFFNKNRVNIICDEIIKAKYDFNIWCYARIDIMDEATLKKMRQAGFRWIAYGIESGSEFVRQKALKGNFTNSKIKEVVKMTQDNDICVMGNFMFGFKQDTLFTMQQTLNLALELNCEFVNFYCLSAFPETELYNELKLQGIELPTKSVEYAQMSKYFKPLDTIYLSGREVLTFRDNAFIKYFSNEVYLNMIANKFGIDRANEICKMLSKKMERLYA